MLGLSRRHHQQAIDRGEAGRGRNADRPGEIPKAGWRDILLRVKNEQSKDNLSMIAAGVAYYALLAVFPALAAMVSVYGLAFDPRDVEAQIASVGAVLPAEATTLLNDQLKSLTSQPREGLGIGAAIGIIVALWSASQGVKALMTSLNIVYDEEETRGFIRFNAMALLLTFAAVLFLLVTLGTIAGIPAVIAYIGLTGPLEWVVRLLRWPLLAVMVMAGLAVLYRYAPDRRTPRWRWTSWGAVLATALWLLGSIAFSVYVSNFGSYDETYGSVGAVVILLLWLNLTAYVILLGGELNAEMEHQTARDTTSRDGNRTGRPLGARDAYVADTVGEKP
ncbi:YihY/virulence factor BrkB family protein [Arenibaculum pallidiluteum]|uniref:YihY/virulence factor BrkB family protein n=1 Tax=Arenibaculum pallidiluteum TaxID=2812559 RepID=UPI001A97B6A6|nr:YihY/virulence factor BrkB family protein [Arenibaculum pallidiluteum]